MVATCARCIILARSYIIPLLLVVMQVVASARRAACSSSSSHRAAACSQATSSRHGGCAAGPQHLQGQLPYLLLQHLAAAGQLLQALGAAVEVAAGGGGAALEACGAADATMHTSCRRHSVRKQSKLGSSVSLVQVTAGRP
jgi:hypothetical protein